MNDDWKLIDTSPKEGEGQFLVWGPEMIVLCEALYENPHNKPGDVALVRYHDYHDSMRPGSGNLFVEHSVYYHSEVKGATHWAPVRKSSTLVKTNE
jgi:hypothetical protein